MSAEGPNAVKSLKNAEEILGRNGCNPGKALVLRKEISGSISGRVSSYNKLSYIGLIGLRYACGIYWIIFGKIH